MTRSVKIAIKRVYEPASDTDGLRVFVDRLWPRGVRKSELDFDVWARELAPSSELRKWFNHRAERFEEFRERYLAELNDQREPALRLLDQHAGAHRVTLLFAASDPGLNNAAVLQEFLSTLES